MTHSPETHQSLIIRLNDHQDQAAWQEFLEIYEPLIIRLARRRGLQHADAVEVTQEIMLIVAQAVDQWKPSGRAGSFRAWLFQIARNLIINHLQRRDRSILASGKTDVVALLQNQPEPSFSSSVEFDLEYRKRLFQWAATRIEKQVHKATWQAFWQTAVEGRSAAAVASEIGVSTGTVYVARCRVMHRFRELIDNMISLGTAELKIRLDERDGNDLESNSDRRLHD